MSMGALGDSFYEYLLKSWLQSGKEDNEARQMFDEAMDAAMKYLLKESPAGLTYFAEMKFERVEHKMDHLACFSGKFNFIPLFNGFYLWFSCRWYVGFGFKNPERRSLLQVYGYGQANHQHVSRVVRPNLHQIRP